MSLHPNHPNNPTPLFSLSNASHIAATLYGLHITNARALHGERDSNFYLQSDTGSAFVLKIAHAEEQLELLDLQNKALAHLAAHDPTLVLPRVCTTTTGEHIVTVSAPDGSQRLVRLLTYIPGKLLAETQPHTPSMLSSLGSMLGRFDHGLQDFTHPVASRTLKWDIQHALWIRDYLHYIPSPEQRAIVEHFLSYFETHTLPLLPTLRTSIIHNDANDYNVLVHGATSTEQGHVISIIDFGDMVQTYTACELVIACAYAMLSKPDPLSAAASVVTGYHEAYPLTETELAVLYPLICMRLCVSVVNSAYQRQLEPENAYLTISEQPAWTLLTQLHTIPPQLAHYTFRHACKLSPCPSSDALTSWLQSNTATFASIVEADLRATTTNKLVFDLSVGSRELSNLVNYTNIDEFNEYIFGRMKATHSTVGIGRYNEPRLIYTSDQYKIAGNNGSEWRTIHLGLDIFMEAETPIFAPLDSIIHSFHNNDAPLDYGPTIILQHTIPQNIGVITETTDTIDTTDTKQSLTFYTLYGHLSLDSLDNLYKGKPIAQGISFCKMGNQHVNGGWPPHLHFQIIADLLDNVNNFPGVALPSQRDLYLSLCPDPNLIVGIPEQSQGISLHISDLSSQQIHQKRSAHIGPSLSISYQQPLKIVRGSGQYLYDQNGQAYLDAVNNVSHVGHCHPRVVRAGQEQMAVLNTNTRYLHNDLVHYAERLCTTLPKKLSVCYFVCSGSEANELALRLARTYTQQKDIIVLDAAYHGNTTALVEISPYKFNGPGGNGATPYVHVVPMPDGYRGPFKKSDPLAAQKYAASVEEAIQQLHSQGGNIAAFIGESLLGCGGQIVLPEGYLEEVYRHVRNAGGVCIADEVQVGFGRVGSHFWGFETQGVVPDIVTMGKPIGNGHPLAAVVTTPEIANAFNNGMEYFNTFGGNPVSCAIGLAVLDVIADEQIQDNALHVGHYLLEKLRSLMDNHPLIGDVRGLGLFVGIELVTNRQTLAPAAAQATYLVNRMREHGILLSTDGPLHNVLKIKPPLVFTTENADLLVTTLDHILYEDFLHLTPT